MAFADYTAAACMRVFSEPEPWSYLSRDADEAVSIVVAIEEGPALGHAPAGFDRERFPVQGRFATIHVERAVLAGLGVLEPGPGDELTDPASGRVWRVESWRAEGALWAIQAVSETRGRRM